MRGNYILVCETLMRRGKVSCVSEREKEMGERRKGYRWTGRCMHLVCLVLLERVHACELILAIVVCHLYSADLIECSLDNVPLS